MTRDVSRERACPRCQGGAILPSRMPLAPELELWTCSACGMQWSLMDCDTRGCRERAVSCCRECNKFKCKGHGVGKSGVCEACKKRYAKVIKSSRPARETNWSRTARLHQ